MRAAHIVARPQVYLVAGFAPPAAVRQGGRGDRRVDRSFRPLTAREADTSGPTVSTSTPCAPGDTWQSIAARGGALVRATELAIMNNHAVNEQPSPG